MHKLISLAEAKFLRKEMPKFDVGDTVDVQMKIDEEGKSRIQTFEGVVIARAGSSPVPPMPARPTTSPLFPTSDGPAT